MRIRLLLPVLLVDHDDHDRVCRFQPENFKRKWESESPNMYIEIGKELETPVSGYADSSANIGEITDEDGSTTKIHFNALHGNFSIFEYDEDWDYSPGDELFYGEYKLKGDTLVLKCNDGTEIILY